MATVMGSDLKVSLESSREPVCMGVPKPWRASLQRSCGYVTTSNCFFFPSSAGFLPLDLDRDPGDSGSVTDGGHGGLNGGSSGSVNGANGGGGGGGGKKKKKKRRHRTIFTSFQVGSLFLIAPSFFF